MMCRKPLKIGVMVILAMILMAQKRDEPLPRFVGILYQDGTRVGSVHGHAGIHERSLIDMPGVHCKMTSTGYDYTLTCSLTETTGPKYFGVSDCRRVDVQSVMWLHRKSAYVFEWACDSGAYL